MQSWIKSFAVVRELVYTSANHRAVVPPFFFNESKGRGQKRVILRIPMNGRKKESVPCMD